MDAAFPFVSSSDRSKYMEICQALSNLNGPSANPDFEDPVEIKPQKPKKVLVEEVCFQPEGLAKAPQDSRKPFLRAKSHSSRILPKASSPQHGFNHPQELATKRSATPRTPADLKKKKPLSNEQNQLQASKTLQRSSSRSATHHCSVKGKQVSGSDVVLEGEVSESCAGI
ncbi:hypothetical protein MPTK2_3g22980 [Marchantia polymorpha subsp. ruderalis]